MVTHYSLDTENGAVRIGGYRTKSGVAFVSGEGVANRVITFARLGIRHFDDVRCIISEPDENVYEKYYQHMKDCEPDTEIYNHVWNLSWEWKPIMKWFVWKCETEGWSINLRYDYVVTSNNWYSLTLMLGGTEVEDKVFPEMVITFVDDNNHFHAKVKDATADLMKNDKYKEIMKEEGLYGKESDKVEELHEIWYAMGKNSEEWKTYIHYAKVDAFCQALLMESLFDEGRFCTPRCYGEYARYMGGTALSASGAGFRDAKSVLIYGCDYKDIPVAMKDEIDDFEARFPDKPGTSMFMGVFLDRKWTDKFGLLGEREQIIVERNLRGGLVYGVAGVHRGVFYHYDYKSSYPYQYAYGKLPVASGWTVVYENGEIKCDKKGNPVKVRRCIQTTKDPEKMQIWMKRGDDVKKQVYILGRLVNFKLKDKAIPFITVKECVDGQGMPIKSYGGDRAKKMKCGNTDIKLWTYEEWKLIDRCYDVEDYIIEEVWMCDAEVGYFKKAVEKYFDKKESTKGVSRAMAKLDLNGATHGRAMIKILTSQVMELDNGKLVNRGRKMDLDHSPDDIKTNPIVGMTAMAHARCRLIEHCMILIENGYQILMNDTDSLVTDCPPKKLKSLLNKNGWKNWLIEGESRKMKDTLGKFDTEIFEVDGVKVEKIDEFRCWGLKRYAEIVYTDELKEGGWVENGKNCLLRKSAFAGMHDEDQTKILGGVYQKDMKWQSSSKAWVDDCYAVRFHDVEAGEEDIWYNGD